MKRKGIIYHKHIHITKFISDELLNLFYRLGLRHCIVARQEEPLLMHNSIILITESKYGLKKTGLHPVNHLTLDGITSGLIYRSSYLCIDWDQMGCDLSGKISVKGIFNNGRDDTLEGEQIILSYIPSINSVLLQLGDSNFPYSFNARNYISYKQLFDKLGELMVDRTIQQIELDKFQCRMNDLKATRERAIGKQRPRRMRAKKLLTQKYATLLQIQKKQQQDLFDEEIAKLRAASRMPIVSKELVAQGAIVFVHGDRLHIGKKIDFTPTQYIYEGDRMAGTIGLKLPSVKGVFTVAFSGKIARELQLFELDLTKRRTPIYHFGKRGNPCLGDLRGESDELTPENIPQILEFIDKVVKMYDIIEPQHMLQMCGHNNFSTALANYCYSKKTNDLEEIERYKTDLRLRHGVKEEEKEGGKNEATKRKRLRKGR